LRAFGDYLVLGYSNGALVIGAKKDKHWKQTTPKKWPSAF